MNDHNVSAMFGHVTIGSQGGASESPRDEPRDRTCDADEGNAETGVCTTLKIRTLVIYAVCSLSGVPKM